MKSHIIITCIILVSCSSFRPALDHDLTMTARYDYTDQTQSDLYDLVHLWFVDAFHESSNVIEYTNEDRSIVSGKYTMKLSGSGLYKSMFIIHTIDNHIEITISHPNHISGSRPSQSTITKARKEWTQLHTSIDQYIQAH